MQPWNNHSRRKYSWNFLPLFLNFSEGITIINSVLISVSPRRSWSDFECLLTLQCLAISSDFIQSFSTVHFFSFHPLLVYSTFVLVVLLLSCTSNSKALLRFYPIFSKHDCTNQCFSHPLQRLLHTQDVHQLLSACWMYKLHATYHAHHRCFNSSQNYHLFQLSTTFHFRIT